MKKIIILAAFLLTQNLSLAQYTNYQFFETFLQKYVDENGKVNYNKINKNQIDLDKVITHFEGLKPKENWSKNEKLAYWINAYNAYSIKLVIDNYPIKSILDINNAWKIRFINIDGSKISLDDIDNRILRKLGEPRIHFAINCASYSCPSLKNRAFYPDTIENELESAAVFFINDAERNNITKKEAKISKLFDWFKDDFTTQTDLVTFLNQYSKIKISDRTKISFLEYNWSLNNVEGPVKEIGVAIN